MKGITIILSVVILFLSVRPCSGSDDTDDRPKDEIGVNHNHQSDSDDCCPITCACNCCETTISYQPTQVFQSRFIKKILTVSFSTYQSIYYFYFHSYIWQPPQLIS